MPIDFTRLDPIMLTPSSVGNGTTPHDHYVEFYDDDRTLVDSVSTFITMGLAEDEAAVIVAGTEHREAIHASLGRSIDLPAAREKGLYASIDAERTLSLFMKNGQPEPLRFEQIIGGLVATAAAGSKKVRVFGEMVALLWEQGNESGALNLESLWNELAQKMQFRLFCAYPTSIFDDGTLTSLGSICHQHSHIVMPRSVAI